MSVKILGVSSLRIVVALLVMKVMRKSTKSPLSLRTDEKYGGSGLLASSVSADMREARS